MPPEMLPKLFVGSSSESLPIVDILLPDLQSKAVVKVWTDRSIFRPAEFYVESLLRVPHLFDFGLFLFEADDVVKSRGTELATPRDNVIFELGLFMSRLGVKRAFAMAPRGRVKILSDIAGLKLIEYDEPPGIADIRSAIIEETKPPVREALISSLKERLKPALQPAIGDVIELLAQGPEEASGVFPDAPNVVHVGPAVLRLVKASLEISGKAIVRHLALDMGEAWGVLANEVLHDRAELNNIDWRCLMIDPESEAIQEVTSPGVSVIVARARITEIASFMKKQLSHLTDRNVRFECRLYAEPPTMHGFLVDRIALLWSMCDIIDGKLEGTKTPYWRFEAADEKANSSHPARAFGNWFDHRWSTARAPW